MSDKYFIVPVELLTVIHMNYKCFMGFDTVVKYNIVLYMN